MVVLAKAFGALLPLVVTALGAAQADEAASAPASGTSDKQSSTTASSSSAMMLAGPKAEELCKSLATKMQFQGLKVNNTFAQYFPEGANPSIELLSSLYPAGTIPKGTNLPLIFDGVGPDWDVKSDAGYGKSGGRAGTNGPVGGLPAFCRFGAFISTSPLTTVLSEVWMPLGSDPNIPLAPVNASDFPQNTTAFLVGENGEYTRVPLYVQKGQVEKEPKPQPGATNPPSPNDYPDPAASSKKKSSDDTKSSSGDVGGSATGSASDKKTTASADGATDDKKSTSTDTATDDKKSTSTAGPTDDKKTTEDVSANDKSQAPTNGGTKGGTKENELVDQNTQDTEQKKPASGGTTGDTGGSNVKRGMHGAHGSQGHMHNHHRSQKGSKGTRTGDEVLGTANGWNGRLVVQGLGGQRGFVAFPDMKQLMSRYMFAVASNNGGHFSPGAGVTWVNGSQFEETLIDFGWRSNHVTVNFAEQVLNAFYGSDVGTRDPKDGRVRRYYLGSSVGAARGLSAMYNAPTDFNGLLLGPPAANFNNMNVGQLKISALHNKTVVKDGWFTQGALYGPIKETVLSQCDELDGVRDNVISEPWKCKHTLNLNKDLLCGGHGRFSKTNGTCLTQAQIKAVMQLYEPTYLDGHYVYPELLPGSEESASSMTSLNNKASGWTQLVVYKFPKLNNSFNPFTDIKYADIQRSNEEDIGKVNALDVDYSKYFEAGGKTLVFHGTHDLVVSPVNTIQLYEKIQKATPAAAEAFKLYLIPGMRHSRGGAGAWHFGLPSQTDAGSRPLFYNTKYDVLLALINWVEQGKDGQLPSGQVAAAYSVRSGDEPDRLGASTRKPTDLGIPTTYQNFNWGVKFTRPLCAWPKKAVYKGGNPSGAQGYRAFACE